MAKKLLNGSPNIISIKVAEAQAKISGKAHRAIAD